MVYLNGKLLPIEEARVPVLDRGFIFGDGVYELVPVYSRVPFRLDEHLRRLERSLAGVKIRNPYSRAQWSEIVYRVIDAQPFEDQGVYFQVTRGVAKRDHAFPKDAQPTVFMMSNPLVNPPSELVERGAAAVSAQDNRWLRCDIKSISLIGNVLLRQLSAQAGAAETILFRDGKLTEASASNVFIVKDGVVAAPPTSSRCTRSAASAGFPGNRPGTASRRRCGQGRSLPLQLLRERQMGHQRGAQRERLLPRHCQPPRAVQRGDGQQERRTG